MRQRCNNPTNPSYYKYGGRGISICPRWTDFRNFLADMGVRPLGTSLDRFPDNNGDLLEACRYMLTLLTDMGHGDTAGAILALAAIAKAEGRPADVPASS